MVKIHKQNKNGSHLTLCGMFTTDATNEVSTEVLSAVSCPECLKHFIFSENTYSWREVKEKYMQFHNLDEFKEDMAADVDFGYWLIKEKLK